MFKTFEFQHSTSMHMWEKTGRQEDIYKDYASNIKKKNWLFTF